MIASQVMQIQPVPMDGKVLIERTDFEAMQTMCMKAQILLNIQEAEKEYAKTGISYDGRKVLADLKGKYANRI